MVLSSYLSTFVSGGSLFFTTNGSAEEKYLTYLFPLGYINVTPFSPSFTSVPFGIWKKLLNATDICCNSLLWYGDFTLTYLCFAIKHLYPNEISPVRAYLIILLFSLPACLPERLLPHRVSHEYSELYIRDWIYSYRRRALNSARTLRRTRRKPLRNKNCNG